MTPPKRALPAMAETIAGETLSGETLSAQALHAQRARGDVILTVGTRGIRRLREDGSLKIRLPSGSSQAILINTAGGIAGGDRYGVSITAETGSRLTITSQAAERVYRTLGPHASVTVRHRVESGASLFWLPQETILFDGSGLSRRLDVDLAEDATFLGLETVIFGRRESGEVVSSLALQDNWSIRRAGRLLHSERLRLEGPVPRDPAMLGQAGALATLLFVSPDAEARLSACHAIVKDRGGVSAWGAKLLVRLAEPDGFQMRKLVLRLLHALLPPADLPKVWLL